MILFFDLVFNFGIQFLLTCMNRERKKSATHEEKVLNSKTQNSMCTWRKNTISSSISQSIFFCKSLGTPSHEFWIKLAVSSGCFRISKLTENDSTSEKEKKLLASNSTQVIINTLNWFIRVVERTQWETCTKIFLESRECLIRFKLVKSVLQNTCNLIAKILLSHFLEHTNNCFCWKQDCFKQFTSENVSKYFFPYFSFF